MSMKVEGGGVATSSSGASAATAAASVLHARIKVKEETKDCCGAPSQRTSSSSSASNNNNNASPPPAQTSTRAAAGLAIGAVATITISSASGEQTAPTTSAAEDPHGPVDLDLKSGARAKGASRDKVPPREDANGTDQSRGSSSPSPSSSPGSQQHYHHHHHHHQSKLQSRAASSSSARSPDSDEGPTLHPLKTEASDEAHNRQQQQQQDEAKCGVEANGVAGVAGGRCISGVFAAHGKLKRLLGTLVQFAMDISPDTGDTVRTLVLGLLSGSMSAEEFHSALQEATNFPLRGFVLPYLKHTLPSLQRDLSAAARADNQTCGQYLRSNEPAVLEAVGLLAAANSNGNGAESVEPFAAEHVLVDRGQHSALTSAHHYNAMRPSTGGGGGGGGAGVTTTASAGAMHPVAAGPPHLGFAGAGLTGKRRASDALYYENGVAAFEDGPPYAKRSVNPWALHHPHHHPGVHHHPSSHHHPGHPHQQAQLHHLPHHQQQQQQPHQHQQQQQQQQQQHPADSAYCWYAHPLSSGHHGPPSIPPSLVQIGGGSSQPTGYGPLSQAAAHLPPHQPLPHVGAPAGISLCAPTQNGSASLDDEWKNIHVMLNCILGMVEKTKRALAILQKRGCTSPASATGSTGPAGLQANGVAQSTNGASGQQQQQQQQQQQMENAATGQDRDGTFKRLSGEIVAQTIRATEDRVAEVKRRAEEAVQEVKRVAVAEVQRAVAVAVAESRASERLRSQRYLDNHLLPVSAQQQQSQPSHRGTHATGAQQQQQQHHGRPSPFLRLQAETTTPAARAAATGTPTSATAATSMEDLEKETHLAGGIGSSCWNCGRPALETCGGCGVARYCGSFCQHRDWEAGGHHASCATTTAASTTAGGASSERAQRTSRTPSPPTRAGSAASDSDAAKANVVASSTLRANK